MARLFLRLCGGLLLVALLLYLADFAWWHVRLATSSGLDVVQVSRVSVATLKGGKEEFYFEGSDDESCARSLFPPITADGFAVPCWWLVRHRQRMTHY